MRSYLIILRLNGAILGEIYYEPMNGLGSKPFYLLLKLDSRDVNNITKSIHSPNTELYKMIVLQEILPYAT